MPVYDASAALRVNPERTEQALQTVGLVFCRNKTSWFYEQDLSVSSILKQASIAINHFPRKATFGNILKWQIADYMFISLFFVCHQRIYFNPFSHEDAFWHIFSRQIAKKYFGMKRNCSAQM